MLSSVSASLTMTYGACSVEMQLVAHRIAEGLAKRGHPCAVKHHGGLTFDALRLFRADGVALEIKETASDLWNLEIEAGKTRRRIPFPAAAKATRSNHSPSLLLFAGDGEMTRRMRMIAKTVSELRRRGLRLMIGAIGSLPTELLRSGASPDAHLPDLDAAELENLLGRATVFLDGADSPSLLTRAGALAASAGIPTLVHADAVAGAEETYAAAIVVKEWSADAFADAVIEAQAVLPSLDAESDVAIEVILEELSVG